MHSGLIGRAQQISLELPAVCRVQVLKPGPVSVVVMYTSAVAAMLSLSIGSYQSIMDGTAPNITAVLPAQVRCWVSTSC
jgi:hypothetical protein